jgi:hypothetical protein
MSFVGPVICFKQIHARDAWLFPLPDLININDEIFVLLCELAPLSWTVKARLAVQWPRRRRTVPTC